jgi:hypothetical protein
MKHITFADKTLFVDDDTSDALVEYAGLLGAEGTADTVRVTAIGGDGNQVEADFVLNAATNLMAETTNSDMQPPRNDEAISYMRSKMDQLRREPSAQPETDFEIGLASADDY